MRASAIRAGRSHSPWPHGLPTRLCETCHGTGLDRTKAYEYDLSRAAYGDGDRPNLACAACDGRGRIIIPVPGKHTQ